MRRTSCRSHGNAHTRRSGPYRFDDIYGRVSRLPDTLSAHAGVEREITKERERQRPLPYGLVRWRAITYQPQLRLDRGWTPVFRQNAIHRRKRVTLQCELTACYANRVRKVAHD